MRILHTSDWHLGRTLHGVDLLDHQEAFLDHLVQAVRSERVDALVVAGDVYDRAIPPVAVVELLAEALERLTEHTRVVLTPGNHDSATRLGFGASLFRDQLVVRSRVEGVGSPVVVPSRDGTEEALVYALPYLDPDTCRHRLAGPETGDDGAPLVPARSHEAVARAAMARVHADLAARRAGGGPRVPALLMAHAFVVGGQPSESERDIRVGGVDSVPLGVLTAGGEDAALDYLALGHLHGPQRVGPDLDPDAPGRPLARYAGSPLAYSFSERHHRKSAALVELGPGGVRSVDLLDVPRPRGLSEVTGTLEALCSPAFDAQAQDWVRVLVTDAVRPPDLYARVRARFPHALVIQHRPESGPSPAAGVSPSLDPLLVAADFVRTVGGADPDGAERAVLARAYEAVLAQEMSA
ncbi:exonuclease SbcCD subunit D [Georgenia faecalis]|uniref:exonuclease SbcCD subunit D n=1 Tax=Georgenia faecalis TaxID=2483799 RepID=UPI000FDB09D4|nr:exonuclease SbcCD subunit D C-terminal domain-containing protein [Georgenia faecalis]